jgi:hypothetical protein
MRGATSAPLMRLPGVELMHSDTFYLYLGFSSSNTLTVTCLGGSEWEIMNGEAADMKHNRLTFGGNEQRCHFPAACHMWSVHLLLPASCLRTANCVFVFSYTKLFRPLFSISPSLVWLPGDHDRGFKSAKAIYVPHLCRCLATVMTERRHGGK